MPVHGVSQPKLFSLELYANWPPTSLAEYAGQIEEQAVHRFWAGFMRLKPRLLYGICRQPQARSGVVVLPSRRKHEAPLTSVEKVRTPAASSACSTSIRGCPYRLRRPQEMTAH